MRRPLGLEFGVADDGLDLAAHDAAVGVDVLDGIWVAASISWASSAIGPVIGTTTPSFSDCWPRARRFTKGNPETAVAAPAPARPFKMVRRAVRLIVVPPLRGPRWWNR